MHHLEILAAHGKFNYIFYEKLEDKLISEFKRMNDNILKKGHGVRVDMDLSGGVLLEDDHQVIAGIFYNHLKYKTALLSLVIYVEPEYRQQGIYRKMVEYLEQVARNHKMEEIFAYFHVDNKIINDIGTAKIGYKPVMSLMCRPVIYKKDT
jgi:GNAT superfamily N-acetyltransferase